MRRGRIFWAVVAAVAVALVALPAPAFAGGSTPMDICHDLQDGKLDGSYTQAQLNAFNRDPSVQGYCSPVAVAATPAAVAPASAVKGAQHTQRGTAPLSTSRSSGTLPFTGVQLSVVFAIGLGLIAAGLALRATARRGDSR